MKSSKIKTVIVECKLKDVIDVKEFTIDSEIFDDFLLEAATQYVEYYINSNHSKIPPILTTWEKKYSKDYNKHICFNSYYIIINAGFHRKAEIMRQNFIKSTNIDLQKESIKTNGKSGTSRKSDKSDKSGTSEFN